MPDARTFRMVDGVPWIGERSFPWAKSVRVEDVKDADYHGRGCQIVFENGYTLSVQWGSGTYSTNHHSIGRRAVPFDEEPGSAEIAVWNASGEWFDWGGDTVKGWNTPDDVLKVVEAVASWPSDAFGVNPLVGDDDE